jgi:hypothetical protein
MFSYAERARHMTMPKRLAVLGQYMQYSWAKFAPGKESLFIKYLTIEKCHRHAAHTIPRIAKPLFVWCFLTTTVRSGPIALKKLNRSFRAGEVRSLSSVGNFYSRAGIDNA